MAGKKTGKRLLTWVLVLVMALSLLPLNALATDGPETGGGSGMNFKKELVSTTPDDDDGTYTIRMTAQATGTTTTTSKAVPMDIVLVLDQSGSMKENFGSGTRQSAMKEAVNSFIGEVAKKYSTNADHRMAIVTFSDDAETLVGWTPVGKDGEATLISKISGLTDTPSGATNVGAGMELAQTLMNNSEVGADRQKTVIVFTDGVPTTETDFNTTVANTAIDAAKNMKSDDVTIYTVGIFNGANPNQLHGDKWNYETFEDVVCDGSVGSCWGGSWLSDLFGSNDFDSIDVPAGNRFLNYLSSNSKNASKIGITKGSYHPGHTFFAGGTGWRIDENADCTTTKGYYMTASTASSLKNIFKVVSDTVPAPDNDKLDENTVITDKLSDYFTFATGTADDVKVSAIDANGNKKNSADADKVKPVVTGNTVTVTGYDFSAHYQGIGGVAEETLVIEIKVKPSGDGCREEEIPTNADTAENHAAKVEVKSEDGTKTTPVTSHETAKVTGHKVIYDLNGGTGSITDKDLYYPQDAVVAVTNSVPTLEGYEFTGWKSDIKDDDTVYTSNGTNSSITMPAANVTLTAQWKVKKDAGYTVHYYKQGTTDSVALDKVVNNAEFGKEYTENAVSVTGYTAVDPTSQNVTADYNKKEITFYYGKADPTPGTFDFNDVVYGDGKVTPAITKTVKGNVGKNFTEAFYVTVKGADEKSAATMSAASYTGEAEVTYSDLKNIAFQFAENDKLTFRDGDNYTYTVREKIPGKTSRMSYDTTEYTLTIKVVLDEDSNTYQVKSWQFTPGNREYPDALNIVNTYRTYHPSTPSKPTLNTGDHYAYVMGYPDGTVRPNGSITRAEVSAILFRLLSDKTRDEYFTTESSFTDVKAGAWYNNSIATLEKAGVIVDTAKGGAFRPNEAITRAELAAMLAQFSDAKPVKGVKFSDVSAEHWAYEAIAIAAKMGWIEGYPDGTFRPDATITRAEMMTLVNRALERVPSDEDHLLSKRVMLTFPDCKSGDWFYIAVQEATNSHTYERAATEKNGDEQWTALRANRDWTLLEK